MGQNQLWLLGASIKCAWLIALLLQRTHLLGPKAKVCFLWFCFLYFFFYIFPPSELGGKGLAVAAVHVCVHTTEKHSAWGAAKKRRGENKWSQDQAEKKKKKQSIQLQKQYIQPNTLLARQKLIDCFSGAHSTACIFSSSWGISVKNFMLSTLSGQRKAGWKTWQQIRKKSLGVFRSFPAADQVFFGSFQRKPLFDFLKEYQSYSRSWEARSCYTTERCFLRA